MRFWVKFGPLVFNVRVLRLDDVVVTLVCVLLGTAFTNP